MALLQRSLSLRLLHPRQTINNGRFADFFAGSFLFWPALHHFVITNEITAYFTCICKFYIGPCITLVLITWYICDCMLYGRFVRYSRIKLTLFRFGFIARTDFIVELYITGQLELLCDSIRNASQKVARKLRHNSLQLAVITSMSHKCLCQNHQWLNSLQLAVITSMSHKCLCQNHQWLLGCKRIIPTDQPPLGGGGGS
jgi:hypothetical protein